MNRLILGLKRNDQYRISDKNMGLKDMMPVFRHDEATMGEFNFSDRLQTQAYLHLEVHRDNTEWLKEICDIEFGATEEIFLRARKYLFNAEQMGIDLRDLDFVSKVRGPGYMGLIDATGIRLQEKVSRAIDIDWSKIAPYKDLRLVTAGTYDVGSGEEDYANWPSVAADTGTQTAELKFNVNSNFTSAGSANMDHDAAGFNYSLGSNTPHGGDVTAALVSTIDHSANGFFFNMSNTGSDNKISGFRMTRSTAGSGPSSSLINALNNAPQVRCFNMFFDGGGLTGSGIRVARTLNVQKYYKILVWDCNSNGIQATTISSGTLALENIGIRNCGNGVDNNSVIASYRNVWSFSNTTDYANLTSAIGNNVSATDTTAFGTNPHDSLTEADEVVSTDDTNPDFGHLKADGTNDGGGVVPLEAIVDMAENTYAFPYPVGPLMEDGDPPPPPPLTIPGSLVKSLVQQVGRTTNGTMTFTGDLGGLIPTAAKFIVSRNTVTNSSEGDEAGSIGFCDGTSQAVVSFQSENAAPASDVDRRGSSLSCIQLLTVGSNVVLVEASFSSRAANSITLNFGTTDGTAYEIVCILYAGVPAQVGNFSPNATQNSGTTISGLGFFPRYIDFVGASIANNDTSTQSKYSIGASVFFNDAIVQGSQTNNDQNGQDPSFLAAITRNNRMFQSMDGSGTLTYSLEVTDMSSGQFIATTREDGGSAAHVVYYLALGTEANNVNLIEMDAPASTGNLSYTGLGFKPDFFTIFGGVCTAYNTLFGDAAGLQVESESMEISYFDGSQTFCQMLIAEDDAGTTNTFCRLQNNRAIQTRDAGGPIHNGNFFSFDPDGLTISYTSAPKVIKLLGVGFKEHVAEITLRGNLKTNLLGGFQ